MVSIGTIGQKIKEVMGSLDRDTVARACGRFHPRIEALVEIVGDCIEYKYFLRCNSFKNFYFNRIRHFFTESVFFWKNTVNSHNAPYELGKN
jgi:hypothetical protein